MKLLLLDVDAIGRDFPEVFSILKRNCPSCGDRKICVLDFQHDPNIQMWEADCQNSEVLNVLVALT
jgi:hypothetical protein